MNDNDHQQNRIAAKFQPVAEPIGFKLEGRTRFYLEYDETGTFAEYDGARFDGNGEIVHGNLVATGIIDDRFVAEERKAA